VWKLSSLRNHRRPPSVPEGIRIYAVGDVHGRADLLALLLSQIEADAALRPISRPIAVFLGDYIDRGEASNEVLELLVTWRGVQEAVFLKGNHEDFFLRFLKDAAVLENWRHCGGLETLVAYGLKPPINPTHLQQARLAHDLAGALPATHRTFLQGLEPFFVCGDFLFVHAGVRPLVPIHQQTEDDLLWIRDEFLFWEKPFEKIVVHGHTPVHEPDIKANRINIDTGAFATGRLTCMVFEGAEIMPLVDVRVWVGRLLERDEQGIVSLGETSSGAALDARRRLAALARAHVRKLKDGAIAGDRDFLARLDPRP
jgi:serine/threonine protein phosphatase 1